MTDMDHTTKSVRHRYSDFEKLHATLKARYSSYGVLVPSLPKKNVVLKGAGFHFQRMRGLQMFCEKVAANPYLREDQAWVDFLEEGRPLVVEKEALPMPPKRWMEAIKDLETPGNAGEMIAGFKTESVKAEKLLNDMIAKSKVMISSVSSLALSITDVATSSVNWSESETNDVELLNTLSSSELSSDAATSSPPNVIARISTLFSSKVSALSNTPEALNLLLVEALDYEGSQMVDFNLLCKHVDKLASLNSSHESTLNKLKGKSTAKMNEAKLAAHEEAIDQAEKILSGSKQHCDLYIRALTMLTLPRVVAERRERIKILSLHIGAVTKAIAAHMLAASDTFFDAMGVNGNDYIDSASMVLEALSLPPLPETAAKGGTAVRVKSSSVTSDRNSTSVNVDSPNSPPPPPQGGATEGQEV
ncbi:hypothetical protein TrRE_jg11575 [Triparma retinervis]|uniref:PX domain-containing protein n=1 Tax=Triparma retinervis TaxID=2557542 RepID=A0A9W7AY80_9STRA|nr:hypothetical protein TrRE_jg11575 [Triparma retinervis]